MHPSLHAIEHPDRPALIMGGSGMSVTFRQLDRRSNQIAHLFRSIGLNIGDTVAIFLDNTPCFLDIAWAAQRSGLYFVCISTKLTAPEVQYIMRDCGAKVLVASAAIGPAPALVSALLIETRLFSVGPSMAGYRSLENEAAAMPTTPIADQAAGTDMLYSSGTTGRPKGIRIALPANRDIAGPTPFSGMMETLWGFGEECTYLSPAPLYHAAPLRAVMVVQKFGGTAVVMEKFEPEDALHLIDRYRVTHSQWVPTHFIRMLKLPLEIREKYDLSSLKVAIHAAAPCPVPIKEAMIKWWGPRIYEYYGGTEGNGLTAITSEEWLAHKGSVGRSIIGTIRICDPDGEPLPPRIEGGVFVEGGNQFEYFNDPTKTAAAKNRQGWTTLGDIGWLDEDGYLYLTDRKSFTIISGGVNVYPQEIENYLITHPKILDVAVIGAPDEEMGEKVVAVVQLADGFAPSAALTEEISNFARAGLSSIKIPRQFDFVKELPRHPTGKLYKRLLRDSYWGKEGSTIV